MSGPRVPILRRLAELRGTGAETDGAEPLLRRLIGSFLSRTPGELDRLDEAVQQGDGATAATVVRRLRGAAANLGADHLAARCAALDTAARAGQLDHARAALPPVRAAYAEVEPVLRDLLTTWPPGTNPQPGPQPGRGAVPP